MLAAQPGATIGWQPFPSSPELGEDDAVLELLPSSKEKLSLSSWEPYGRRAQGHSCQEALALGTPEKSGT